MTLAGGWFLDLDGGPLPYADVWALQRAMLQARQCDTIPDVLTLLEHRPVVTLGRSANRDHLLVSREALAARGIEVYEVERGGSATYHGPGQLVGYPIVDLRAVGEDVGRFVHTLETTVIETVAAFGIPAMRRPGYPGVWVGEAKICALGVAIRRRVTMHGFALNVNIDLEGFTVINPCGLGRPVVSMASILGRPVDMAAVRRAYVDRFASHFGIVLERRTLDEVRSVLDRLPVRR